jgi:uncharacterized protein
MLNRLGVIVLTICIGLASSVTAEGSREAKAPVEKAPVKKAPVKVLIIDGQNNHDAWPKSTMMMKKYLESTGKFSVDIARTQFTWKGGKYSADFPLNDGKKYEDLAKPKADPNFAPKFSNYDVVISNFGFGAADWPLATQKAFVDFVKSGGGFVSIHAADNSFPQWREYNEMIGLGGWGGRDQKSGPYVYYDDSGKVVRDQADGRGGGHGPQHEFSIVIRDEDHPITSGVPAQFMHTKDELYERLRGPAINMNILATAFAAPAKKGSGRHEPTMMTIDFGKGRVFHSTLGHADYSFECVGFQTLFLRGTEWAATGEVTIAVPDDFPTATKASSKTFK